MHHLEFLYHLCSPLSGDVIHCHFDWRTVSSILWANRLWGRRIVVTVHNQMVAEMWGRLHAHQKPFARHILSSPAIRWIAVSQVVRERLLELGVSESQMTVAPAYLNPPESALSTDRLSSELLSFAQDHAPVLAVYGYDFARFDGRDLYGFDKAIELIQQLATSHPEIGLIIVCPAGNDSRDRERLAELKALAGKLNVSHRLYWQLQPVPEAVPIWNLADIYIRPSLTDGDAVAIRECLWLGVPVVASDAAYRPDGTLTYPLAQTDRLTGQVRRALKQERCPRRQNDDSFPVITQVYHDVWAR